MAVRLHRKGAKASAAWTLAAVATTALGTYPFILKVVAPPVYYVTLAATILALCLSTLRPFLAVDAVAIRGLPRWLVLFVGMYLAYLAALAVNTAVNGGPPDAWLGPSASLVMRLLLAASLWLFVPLSRLDRSIGWFTWLVTILAFLGVVMVVLIALGILPVLGEIRVETFGPRDTGIRQFYGLGFGWNRLHIAPDLAFPRLQSFTAEAGNFAFLLIIAGIWHIRYRRWILATSLGIPLLLTWSLGAIVTAATLLLLSLLSLHAARRMGTVGNRAKTMKRVSVALLGLSMVLAGYALFTKPLERIRSFTVEDYLASKFDPNRETTSLGVRAESVSTILDEVAASSGQGRGIGGLARLDISLALGWLRALFEAGIIGWMFYLGAMGTLLARAAIRFVQGGQQSGYHAAILLTLASAAFQRAPMDATAWHWWLIVAFIKADLKASAATSAAARAHELQAPRLGIPGSVACAGQE